MSLSVPLSHLLAATAVMDTNADPLLRVESLCCDSRQATPGSLFFALRGVKAIGTEFVAQAAERGAIAIVSDAVSNRYPPSPICFVASACLMNIVSSAAGTPCPTASAM